MDTYRCAIDKGRDVPVSRHREFDLSSLGEFDAAEVILQLCQVIGSFSLRPASGTVKVHYWVFSMGAKGVCTCDKQDTIWRCHNNQAGLQRSGLLPRLCNWMR